MTLRNILRYIVLTGVFILPFAVLIVSNSLFFPYITGKNFFFRIVAEIIFISWTALAVLDSKYRPKISWILGSVIGFVGIITIADIFGAYPLRSFWSNFERMDGLINLLHMFGYLLALVGVLNTEKLWSRFWNTFVGVSLIEGLYVASQAIGVSDISLAGDRADGTLGNPIYLAGFMLVMFFITLWLLYRTYVSRRTNSTIWRLIFYVVSLFLQVFAIFASGTRGSMLGLFGGLLLTSLICALFARAHPRIRKAGGAVIILLIVFGGIFFAARNTGFVQNNSTLSRLASISWKEGTGAARLDLWGVAIEGFKERPVLGWGQENYIQVFTKHYEPKLYAQEPWFDRAHNIFLDWLIAGGVLGLLSYLLIWAALLWGIWSKRSRFNFVEKALFTGLLAAYFIHNLFVFDNVVSYLLFFSLIGFIYSKTEEGRSESDNASSVYSGLEGLVLLTGAVILFIMIWQLNIKPIKSASDLIKGLSLSRAPVLQIPQAISYLESAQERSPLGRAEVRAQTAISATALASETAVGVEPKQDMLTLADRGLRAQEEEDPESARMRLLHGLLLKTYGQYEEAFEILEEGLSISPNKQELYQVLGDTYLAMGDYEKAIEISNRAWELDTSYNSLRGAAVKGLLALGRIEEAREVIFEEGIPLFVGGDMIQAFIDVGDFESARKLIKSLVSERGEDAQSLVSAAAAYVQIGEKELAIQLIEEAIRIEPRFESQGKSLIEQIESGEDLGGGSN